MSEMVKKNLDKSWDRLPMPALAPKTFGKRLLLVYGVGMGAPIPFEKKNSLHFCQK